MLFTGIGFADEIDGMRFTHIGLEDGLSHSTIFGINQDKEGNACVSSDYCPYFVCFSL